MAGHFEHLVLRRPYRTDPEEDGIRHVEAVAASQQASPCAAVVGRLIGFWTPALIGRVSVPEFHFHFLDEAESISGQVLEFAAERAVLGFEEKPIIEVTNPQSAAYKALPIDLEKLDNDDPSHREIEAGASVSCAGACSCHHGR
ncbi:MULTISPECIES: acetolactate decarboxylase [unclassified Asaia]|uniref:acetolactate decarboxylase n=1 Tax=unclassified Asaia TaxID=2685023 RepID=UPI00131580C8|nr:acetolactate decarboxylase [Asaia sp. W19]